MRDEKRLSAGHWTLCPLGQSVNSDICDNAKGFCMLKLLDIFHLHYRHFIPLILCCFCHRHAIFVCVCMLLNLLNACIINLFDISILFFNINLLMDRVLFVRMYKTTVYYLSACSNRRGTICPRV